MSLDTTVLDSNTTVYEFQESPAKKIIKVILYCILFVVSFTGNLLILWATSRDIRLRSTTNILIANMAVSDLIFAIFSVPIRAVDILNSNIWLIEGDFGLALCKLAPHLQDVSLAVSIYSCVFIALDRFYAVVHPLRGGLIRGKLKYIIPGMWVFSIALFSTYFFILTLVKTGDSTNCIIDFTRIGVTTILHRRIYCLIILALNVGIPLPIISFLYLRIALKLRRTTIPGQAGNTSSVRQRQNINGIKMSAMVVSLIFLSFLPFPVTMLLWLFGNLDNLSPSGRKHLFFSVTFINQSSCFYNFFIYLVFTQVYRQNFKDLLSKCTCVNSCSGRFRTNSFPLENVDPVEQEEVDVDGLNELN